MPHYDWQWDQVFDGYDPVVDGFAYPLTIDESPVSHELCSCTQDPRRPEQAIICEYCFKRLLSES